MLSHISVLSLLLFTPCHPKPFHFASNGLLSSPCIIMQSTFATLRCVSFCLAFLVTKPKHIIPAEDETYFYTEWQNVICINCLVSFSCSSIWGFVWCCNPKKSWKNESDSFSFAKGERCSDVLGHGGKVMPGSPAVTGPQESLWANTEVTTRTLEVTGDLWGRMKCW